MRAKKKNKVVPYLDSLYEEKRGQVINWAIERARKKTIVYKQKQADMKELSKRAKEKRQKKMKLRANKWRKN